MCIKCWDAAITRAKKFDPSSDKEYEEFARRRLEALKKSWREAMPKEKLEKIAADIYNKAFNSADNKTKA